MAEQRTSRTQGAQGPTEDSPATTPTPEQQQEREDERKSGLRGGDDRRVKQQVYRTDTQAAVAKDRGDDDSEGERELELPEDVDRVQAYTQVDPEVSLETVNPEDRDRVLSKTREGEVGLTKEERFARKEQARDERDVRESRRAAEHKESRDSGK